MKSKLMLTALTVLCGASAWAGPPFQTDDPEPIEFRHYEFYTFASSDGTPIETDTLGPAVEFNWGALPNVHLHIIIPAAAIFPRDDPRAFGPGDIETGIKYRFVQESKSRPMMGTFVMFELPTGNADRGLGIGKAWFKLPLWLQKSWGPWTSYGGGERSSTAAKFPVTATTLSQAGLYSAILEKTGHSVRRPFFTVPKAMPHPDAGLHAGRFRRLLQISRRRKISASFFLWPLGRRSGRNLCIPRFVLDLGQEGR